MLKKKVWILWVCVLILWFTPLFELICVYMKVVEPTKVLMLLGNFMVPAMEPSWILSASLLWNSFNNGVTEESTPEGCDVSFWIDTCSLSTIQTS